MNGSSLPQSDPAALGMRPDALERAFSFIEGEVERGTVPGALLAATRHGQIFAERCWGVYADSSGPGKPLDPSVRVMFYSFSKVISATIVAMAHQEGLLDYDTPVRSYIPEFAAGGKENVTLRHLLTHSAGIPSAPALHTFTPEGWRRAVMTVCAFPVEWQPGSRTFYHAASGLLIAAEVVRRVTGGEDWEAIARQRLLDPLRMERTSFLPPPPGVRLAITPAPDAFPCALEEPRFVMLGHPAGGAIGPVTDMLRLLNLHLQGGAWQGAQLLAPAEVAEMQRPQYQEAIDEALKRGETPAHEYWGLGWLLRGQTREGWFGFGEVASPRAFGHAGINTVIGIADPARGLAMAFVTTGSPPCDSETIRLRNTVTNLVMRAAV